MDPEESSDEASRRMESRDPAPSGASVAAASVMVGRGSAVGREAGLEGGGLLRLLLGGELGRVDVLAGQQVVVDLAQRDRQRLLLHVGVHEGADVLQEALTELGVVGVDLARTLRAV